MDPNACLVAFLDACAESDRESALELLENFTDWIDAGGFLPLVAILPDTLRTTTLGEYRIGLALALPLLLAGRP